MKQIIVAMDKNRGIGADNDLLWPRDLPADLSHFKKMTDGQTVIMGRKTFESIGHPLRGRQNIVVTSSGREIEGVELAPSLTAAYKLARHAIFVIGGERIYREALESIDRLQVTEVAAVFPRATVFFPEIQPDVWKESSREHHEPDECNKYPYDFVTYDRI